MYKKMLQYFLKKYKELHGKDYAYIKAKLGLVYMQFKRLNTTEKEFQSLIDWLVKRKKLSSINFLMVQLNDFHASKEYQDIKTINETILHYDIMKVREEIISKCKLCKSGYINKIHQCKCLKKFLRIRDVMKKENV